jgi:signal transduction histidine kinase
VKQSGVSLSKDEYAVELTVSDDSAGTDPDQVPRTGADGTLGFTGLRERAELTAGRFSIESTPDKGAT